MTSPIQALDTLALDLAPTLLSLVLRSAAVLALAWVAAWLIRRASAAARHMVWLAAMLSLLALPVLRLLPGWQVIPAGLVPAPLAASVLAPGRPMSLTAHEELSAAGSAPGPSDAGRASEARVSVGTALVGLWGVGVVLCLLPGVLGRAMLRREERCAAPAKDPVLIRALERAGAELGLSRRVRLLVGAGSGMPMAWGMLRPRILLPAEAAVWPASQLRAAILHELAHIKRHDCAVLVLVQVCRALYWCNPLVWVAARCLQAERERACDDMVLAAGTGGPDYARDLLLVAAGRRLGITAAAAMAMARPSHLEGRIRDVLDGTRRRGPLGRGRVMWIAGACAVTMIPVAVLRGAAAKEGAMTAQHPMAQPDIHQCSVNALHLATCSAAYSFKHDDALPADLGSLYSWWVESEKADAKHAREIAKEFLCPLEAARTEIPESPTAEWINQHTSYVIVGAGQAWSKIPYTGMTALIHERFELGHVFKSPDAGEQRIVLTGMAIGCGSPLEEKYARGLVEESKEVFEALKTGGPFPDSHQMMWDLTQIWKAVTAYSEDHGGALPPDLGSTLAYFPADPQRAATPAQRAAAYLAPAAKRVTQVPANPTPEWVTRHASYTYLGGPGLQISRVPDHMDTVILHARDAGGFVMRTARDTRVIPTVTLRGDTEGFDEKMGNAAIEDSARVLEAVRTGAPLPDWRHAHRDLQVLLDATNAYAKEHDGKLPPDLGATLPYIKADLLPADTTAERAKVYLSPPTEKTVQPPAQLTPEWVNQHATYVYEGAGLTLKQARNAGQFVLIHPDPREDYWAPKGADRPVLPAAYAFGLVGMSSRDEVALREIEATKAAIREILTPTK